MLNLSSDHGNRYVDLLSIFENVNNLVELDLYKSSGSQICKVAIQSASNMAGCFQNFVCNYLLDKPQKRNKSNWLTEDVIWNILNPLIMWRSQFSSITEQNAPVLKYLYSFVL